MNPFLNIHGSTTYKAPAEVLPVYKEYAYNFDTDKFKVNHLNQHIIVEKNEALKVWIYKALKTERFRYIAYSGAYGGELEQFINKSNINATGETMKQYIKDCLMVNPYITKVNKIDITRQSEDIIILTIYLTTIYGSIVQEVNL